MKRGIKWFDYVTMNIYWSGLTAISQTMTPLVVPLLVQQFVGEAQKGTYYGQLRLWQLMTALLVQALMGMLSDNSGNKWGRRRPFILAGTIGVIIIIVLIGFSTDMSGMPGYWFLFAMIMLLMVGANTAHGAQQGIIPDLVPINQRGRFSGVKAIFEIPLPIILVGFTIGRLVKTGNIWGGLITLICILVVTSLVTMFIPEEKNQNKVVLNWEPFFRLILMTAIFTVIILLMGAIASKATDFFSVISSNAYLWVLGAVGLLTMVISVFLGVQLCTMVSLGKEKQITPSFTWWVINRLSFLVGSTNLVSFIVYFLQGRLGYAGNEAAGPASNMTILVGAFILVAALPSGWLSDRFGPKLLVIISAILAAIGTVLIISFPVLTFIYLGACLVGMAAGLFYTVNWALGTEIVPKEHAGKYLGISNLAGAGAGAIGAYIGGPLADQISLQYPETPASGYIVLFIIYAALFIFSIFAANKIHIPKTTNG